MLTDNSAIQSLESHTHTTFVFSSSNKGMGQVDLAYNDGVLFFLLSHHGATLKIEIHKTMKKEVETNKFLSSILQSLIPIVKNCEKKNSVF